MESNNSISHSQLIDELRKELSRRRKKGIFVTHYDDVYGANIQYDSLSKTRTKAISKEHYQIPYSFIQNWLRVLFQLRNVCAHYGRLYNKKLVVKLLLDTKAAKIVGNNRIFGVIFEKLRRIVEAG